MSLVGILTLSLSYRISSSAIRPVAVRSTLETNTILGPFFRHVALNRGALDRQLFGLSLVALRFLFLQRLRS